jgi:putative FmdB family regulatory protein
MPIYDYRCAACGHRIEVVHGVDAPGPMVCPSCGVEGSMRKLIAAPAVHFKGSGWAKKDRSATATPGTSQAQRSPSKPDPDKPATDPDKPATGADKPATDAAKAAGGTATATEASGGGTAKD